MKEINFIIRENREIARSIYRLVLGCEKGEHGITAPGQFINIRVDGFFLRRPISICSWEDDSVTVIYKIAGQGTEVLATYEEGRVLNALSALGNGFDTSKEHGASPVLIGGGIGTPPMYGLCRQLMAEGTTPKVVLGFNTASDIFYREKFEELGAEVIVATADGTFGKKGFVTDALKEMDFSYFYTCGPEAMLKAVDGTIDKDIDGQLSFEERMGCGFGACMGCSCETKYGNKRICKDGPVLERGEIIW